MSNGDRFWEKVNRNGPTMPHMDSPCWVWTAGKRGGYGVFGENGKTIGAHRYSYALRFGTIPQSTNVLHSCDNPSCVNPDHLFLGTQIDNINDMISKGRQGERFGDAKYRIIPTGDKHWTHIQPDNIAVGERNGNSKLTRAEVIKIRQRYEEGNVYQHQLATEFSVSQALIWKVVNYKIWRNIE